MPKKDNDFKPITFAKEVNGEKLTRVAENVDAAVKYRFDGWREVRASKATAGTTGGGSAGSKSS